MSTIKRVERPTTKIIDDEVPRVDERESGFNKASRGDYGAFLAKERARFVMKHPLSAALMQMQTHLRDIVDGVVASQRAPLPEDPAVPFSPYQGDCLLPAGRFSRHLRPPAIRRLQPRLSEGRAR